MQMTWKAIENTFLEKLASLYPQEEIKELFYWTIEEIAQIKKHEYTLVKHAIISSEVGEKIADIIKNLQIGQPIQHILGKGFFFGNSYHVNEHTLIPRPETEELVQLIIEDCRDKEDINIIDIGTGTGCIAISLSKHLQGNVTAIDVSREALNVAKQNSENLDTKINFILADILEWEFIFSAKQNFDIIVSNPPYITPKEKQEMHANVIQFEPHLALFVEETAPLLFYDHIADLALYHLAPDGKLYFEINQYLSLETSDLLRKKGFKTVEIFKDINSADRMIRASF